MPGVAAAEKARSPPAAMTTMDAISDEIIDRCRAYLDGEIELDQLEIGSVPAPRAPDLRLVFLERAAARLRLVCSGDMTLDDAVAGLVEAVEEIIGERLLCPCVTLRLPEGTMTAISALNRAAMAAITRRKKAMFIVHMPKDFKVGDTADCRINSILQRVTWRDETTLVIEPDDARTIVGRMIERTQVCFICGDQGQTAKEARKEYGIF
jgi:hypothetical protein